MSEVLGVKRRESLAVVDGLANDNHGRQRQTVIMDNLRQVLQFTAIDSLVWPCQMIAGGHRSVLWILLQEFLLHLIDDGRGEEDAHRALAPGQQVQLLFLWHGCASFTPREDDRLTTLRDRELAL